MERKQLSEKDLWIRRWTALECVDGRAEGGATREAEVVMAMRISHFVNPYGVREHAIHSHPHAHQIGFAAALIGLIGIPLGPVMVPSLVAIGL